MHENEWSMPISYGITPASEMMPPMFCIEIPRYNPPGKGIFYPMPGLGIPGSSEEPPPNNYRADMEFRKE